MFLFIKVVVVMYLFIAIKPLTKTEVGTRDWGIVVIGLTVFCLEEFGLLVRKAVE